MGTIFASLLLAISAGAASGQSVETPPSLTPTQMRDELSQVRRDYVARSPSFDAAARVRANRLIDRLSADADRLDGPHYLIGLARVAAAADNGHDSLDVSKSPLRPRVRLPLRLVWLDDRLLVARAAPLAADLVGCEVRRLGTLSPARLADRLAGLQGGLRRYARWNMSWVLHNPAMLEALGVSPAKDETAIDVTCPDGRARHRMLRAVAAAEVPPIPFPAAWWSPTLAPSEQRMDWRTIRATTPLYLQQPERLFRTAELPAMAALYVQFRDNSGSDDEPIDRFVATVADRLANAPPHNLILDLRFDTGGDNTRNRALMRTIAAKVPGRTFVIVGPYTFSAGIASLAAVVHDGNGKVTIVGEPIGDRTHWWSEREDFCLPFSKACLHRQVGKWDVVNGCAGQRSCYGDQFDLRVRRLRPSLPAPLTAAAWRAGRDPSMEAVANALR